jgi:integrase
VRVVVRWRAPGFAHPRKRTFVPTQAQAAIELAQQIRAAQLIAAPADAEAMPVLGGAQSSPAASRDTLGPTQSVKLTITTSAGLSGTEDLGFTISEARQILQAEYAPQWQHSNNLGWWINQLDTLEGCYRYAADHPAVAQYGVEVGSSIHLSQLIVDDCGAALRIRRHTNLKAVHNNATKKAAYEAKLARYEESQVRSGGGRRMAKPTEPDYAVEYDPNAMLIKDGTEKHFRMVQSFLFDRAYDRGWFGAGHANTWRIFNERSSGGRSAAQRSPFRIPKKINPLQRLFPPAGFFADLGDELACLGAQLSDERRLGERYRYLPLIAWQTALRPGENANLQIDFLDLATPASVYVIAELGGHIKSREADDVRTVPLAALIAHLLKQHIASGFATSDGYLWASPHGHRFNTANWTRNFLRPALARTLELWPEYADMATDTMKLYRKAGESSWITYRLDTSLAAQWAGHDEATQLKHYKGVLATTVNHPGAAHRWTGIDDYVHAALRDTPSQRPPCAQCREVADQADRSWRAAPRSRLGALLR